MRLIDADRLKSYIDCGHLRPPTEVCFSELDVCNMIDKAPTVSAEAVEVVRCKECKHKYVSGNGTTQYYVCDFMDAQYEENGFCHYAEREVEE